MIWLKNVKQMNSINLIDILLRNLRVSLANAKWSYSRLHNAFLHSFEDPFIIVEMFTNSSFVWDHRRYSFSFNSLKGLQRHWNENSYHQTFILKQQQKIQFSTPMIQSEIRKLQLLLLFLLPKGRMVQWKRNDWIRPFLGVWEGGWEMMMNWRTFPPFE